MKTQGIVGPLPADAIDYGRVPKSSGMGAINSLAREIHGVNEAVGWDVVDSATWDEPDKASRCLVLIHSEVTEVVQELRAQEPDPVLVAEELADIVIRTLSMAHGLGLDIEHAIRNKVRKNRIEGPKKRAERRI